jgi:hypothetical protein
MVGEKRMFVAITDLSSSNSLTQRVENTQETYFMIDIYSRGLQVVGA